MPRTKVIVGIVVGVFCLLYVLVNSVVYGIQKRLIFPGSFRYNREPYIDCVSLNLHRFETRVSDDVNYHYYDTAPDDPNAETIVFFHGNNCCALHCWEYASNLRRWGFRVILFEYPGYGNNKAVCSQKAILTSARYFMRTLLEHTTQKVTLMGESLGTAPATYLAAQFPTDIKHLCLISPFPSIRVVCKSIAPVLPWRWLLHHPFQSYSWAVDCEAPVTILHGEKDELIPLSVSQHHLQNFVKSPDARFYPLPDSGHNDVSMNRRFWVMLRKRLTEKDNPMS